MPKRWIAHGCLALILVACGDDGDGSEAQRGGLDTPLPGEDRDKSLPCEERSYDECEDDQCYAVRATELRVVGSALCTTSTEKRSCRARGPDCADNDAVTLSCDEAGTYWLTPQTCIPADHHVCEPPAGVTDYGSSCDGDRKSKLVPADVPSGSCSLGAGGTATWDASARKLSFEGMWWVLNEAGLVVSKGQIADQAWRHEFTYDEHQTPTSFNYYWQGEVVPSNSWTQVNTYDEEGRLTRSVRTYLDVVGHVSVVDYEYTDGELTSESRVSTPDAQTSPAGASVTRYIREGALVREVIHEFAGVIRNRTLAFYDDEGRLVRLDSDGNGLAPTPDGTPDIRLAWTYDDQGNCTGFTQDGTEAFDAPFVDGVPDETRTFDPSCASIAFLPQELYRYPAWYTPR